MLNAVCGACKGKHETIAEYRNCSGAPQSEAEVMDNLSGTQTTINPPSDKQVEYAMDLLANRVWPDGFCEEDLRGMERRTVSELIDALHKAPRKAQDRKVGAKGSKTSTFRDVPNGRYALKDSEGVWNFFQVNQGRTVTFLDRLIGSPGAYRKQSVRGRPASIILLEIQKDPRKASADFGLQSKTCGVCSSPLTNEESLEIGIGPKCRSKMGW